MTSTPAPNRPRRGWPFVLAGLLLLALAALAAGEWLGWPGLAGPLQRRLTEQLGQRVSLQDPRVPTDGATPSASAPATASSAPVLAGPAAVSLQLLGGVRLRSPWLEIAAPAWSSAPFLLQASEVDLGLRYTDLWRAWHGQPLRIDHLRAAWLASHLERLADGRVSWQFGPAPLPTVPPARLPPLPQVGQLQVTEGLLHYRDALRALEAEARLSLIDAGPAAGGPALRMDVEGRWHDRPLTALLTASGALPWVADQAQAAPLPVTLDAKVGSASLAFKGSAVDALHLDRLTGHFKLQGPSLAAVGDPLGVTLPSTKPFQIEGDLVKQAADWRVVVADAKVGASRLNGAFLYQSGLAVPLLSGRLGGSRLLLTDLGPALGVVPAADAASQAQAADATSQAQAVDATSQAQAATAATRAKGNGKGKGKGKVLPNRPFDLASLRVMDAQVLIDIAEVDLHSRHLEPLRPLHTLLELKQGVLTLHDLDARTAQGSLTGMLRLDGRDNTALWLADLRWDGVRLERWIQQDRANHAPPWVSGQLSGRARLAGRGRSTAEILASLKGSARTELRRGAVSHLAIEAAGLDLAQGLGVWLAGDDALPVSCAVADLVVDKGIFRPQLMVVDTPSSAIWVEGWLSLATETLELRAVVSPKNFSPLTLRSPLRVSGPLAHPVVSFELTRMAPRLAAAILLALVNPLAVVIPLLDPGDAEAAQRGAAGCQGLLTRHAAAQPAAKPAAKAAAASAKPAASAASAKPAASARGDNKP